MAVLGQNDRVFFCNERSDRLIRPATRTSPLASKNWSRR